MQRRRQRSDTEVLTDLVSNLLKADRTGGLAYLVQGNYMDQNVANQLQHQENVQVKSLLIRQSVNQLLETDRTKAKKLYEALISSKNSETAAKREQVGLAVAENFLKFWNMGATKAVEDLLGPEKSDLPLPVDKIELDIEGLKVFDIKLPTGRSDHKQQSAKEASSTAGAFYSTTSASNAYTARSNQAQSYSGDGSGQSSQQRQHLVKHARDLRKSKDYYKMTSNPRGYCIIIKNVDFEHHQRRQGSDTETNFLESIFDQLFFDVKVHRNLTCTEMQDVLEAVAQDEQLSNHDAFICIILSHGNQNGIVGVDGDTCSLFSLIEILNNKNCPKLRNKPKVFFVQACRGRTFMTVFSILTRILLEMKDKGVVIDGGFDPPEERRTTVSDNGTKIPTSSDFYICYPSLNGHIANRDIEIGSWFGNILGEMLKEHAWECDLEAIMKKVAERLKHEIGFEGSMQSTCTFGILWTRKLFFNPGHYVLGG